jgi:O-acetyl-ADP-ribose deacetylase (regulator of RNase III)
MLCYGDSCSFVLIGEGKSFMIINVYGDIFQSVAKVLVNPVNTVGTMSHDIADTFKQVYPEMFNTYEELCHADNFNTGQLLLYKTPHKWVLNFATKKHFRAHSKLEYIEDGLKKIASVYAEQNFTSLSLPRLGIDDGLNWQEDVKPLIESYLGTLPIMVYVHHPEEIDLHYTKPNIVTLNKWLNGIPEQIPFETFWRGISSLVRRNPSMTTLDKSQRAFKLSFKHEDKERQLISLKISPEDNEEVFIPQSLLRDLWQYIIMSGYCLPQNLPGGLDAYGDELVTLLSKLSVMRGVYLAADNGERVIGLHYIPQVVAYDEVSEDN